MIIVWLPYAGLSGAPPGAELNNRVQGKEVGRFLHSDCSPLKPAVSGSISRGRHDFWTNYFILLVTRIISGSIYTQTKNYLLTLFILQYTLSKISFTK